MHIASKDCKLELKWCGKLFTPLSTSKWLCIAFALSHQDNASSYHDAPTLVMQHLYIKLQNKPNSTSIPKMLTPGLHIKPPKQHINIATLRSSMLVEQCFCMETWKHENINAHKPLTLALELQPQQHINIYKIRILNLQH